MAPPFAFGMHHGRLTLGGHVVAAVLFSGAAGAQAPQPTDGVDGLLHAALTLDAQNIDIAFAPDLAAGTQGRALLAGQLGARVRVGTLEGHRALRLGSIAPDLTPPPAPAPSTSDDDDVVVDTSEDEEPDADEATDDEPERAGPTTPRYELWLVRQSPGWTLEAHASDGVAVHDIPLGHRATETPSPQFTASVSATAAEAGRLVLRWGRHAWSTDFRFEELPRPPRRPRVSGRGQEREADTDTTDIARRNMLAERNETAVVLANGARVGVLYWKGIDVEDEDFGHLSQTVDGAVVQLIRAAPPRLRTDVTLRFGETALSTGNLAAGFPGVYAVWLRKVADGWRFVFNNEADSWGTQHNPSFDAAEVDAEYSRSDASFRPLGVTLVPVGGAGGRLVVHWGPHAWAADFVVTD